MCVADSRILFRRIFEFDNADRYAVDEKQDVGAAVLASLFHDKLVDAAKNIMVGMLEVDVFQSERIAPAVAVGKVISVPIELESVLQSEVVVLTARVA